MLNLITGRSSFWLRGITAGSLLATLYVLAIGLAFAAARDEQPFRRGKLVPSDSMDVAVGTGIPIAAPLGALLSVSLAERLWRARGLTRGCSGLAPRAAESGRRPAVQVHGPVAVRGERVLR